MNRLPCSAVHYSNHYHVSESSLFATKKKNELPLQHITPPWENRDVLGWWWIPGTQLKAWKARWTDTCKLCRSSGTLVQSCYVLAPPQRESQSKEPWPRIHYLVCTSTESSEPKIRAKKNVWGVQVNRINWPIPGYLWLQTNILNTAPWAKKPWNWKTTEFFASTFSKNDHDNKPFPVKSSCY